MPAPPRGGVRSIRSPLLGTAALNIRVPPLESEVGMMSTTRPDGWAVKVRIWVVQLRGDVIARWSPQSGLPTAPPRRMSRAGRATIAMAIRTLRFHVDDDDGRSKVRLAIDDLAPVEAAFDKALPTGG